MRGAPTERQRYADVMRGEAFKRNSCSGNPGNSDFPRATNPTNYWRYTGWTGFAPRPQTDQDLERPERTLRKKAPQIAVRRTYDNESKDIIIAAFTDERYELSPVR